MISPHFLLLSSFFLNIFFFYSVNKCDRTYIDTFQKKTENSQRKGKTFTCLIYIYIFFSLIILLFFCFQVNQSWYWFDVMKFSTFSTIPTHDTHVQSKKYWKFTQKTYYFYTLLRYTDKIEKIHLKINKIIE